VRKTKAILKELMPKFGMTDWTVELAGNTTEELAIAMETLGVAYLAMSIANPAVKHLTVRINVEVHRSDSELRQTILHELFHAAAADVGMDEDKITASGQHDRWEAMMDRLSWIAQRLEGGTV
jgi:acetolactate synthase small subunit